MNINALYLKTFVSGDYYPERASVYADIDFTVGETNGRGGYTTVFINTVIDLDMEYKPVGPDFTIAIPEGVVAGAITR